MAIQWYPGHMKAAKQEIAEAMPSNDIVLEVLDARMPHASSNPILTELRRDKPCIKLLTKGDLADAEITKAWIQRIEATSPNCSVLEIALTQASPVEVRTRVAELCQRLVPHRNTRAKTVRGTVVGVPNVGKSTLINLLRARTVTRVSDQPGVTRGSQIVQLDNGMIFSDNAGILWRRMDESSSMRLALGGAIPESELDYEIVGSFAAAFFLERYPELVQARYGVAETPLDATGLLNRIGRRHGALRAGGRVDLHKASGVLVHDFRSGKLGRISLERPDDVVVP